MVKGQVLGVITARGGSKGIPFKNKRLFAGEPLVLYSIRSAKASKHLTRTVVSTDDSEILAMATEARIETLQRPEELSEDTSTSLEVLQHAVRHYETHHGFRPDLIVTLQPTSPMRTGEDIDACIELQRRHKADSVVSVCVSEPHPSWLFRIETNGTGTPVLVPCLSGDLPEKTRRQDFDAVHKLNGAMVYVTTYDLLMHQGKIIGGTTIPYPMEAWASVDLDQPADWVLGEMIMENQAKIRRRIAEIESERRAKG